MVKPPEISEPPPDGSPFGYFCHGICGAEMSSLSSTIAKCWLDASADVPSDCSWPRWASLLE